ncbi:MAG: putative 2-aminoethylphosphonate ABC transporter permease subunit, partial [Rubrivivax sp.]|nr:putative 2-aminoethylphosphonate ABC transporter permease subunit [Rubrivivax sp.]
MTTVAAPPPAAPLRLRTSTGERIAVAALAAVALLLLAFLAAPLGALLMQALQDRSGDFVGVANFVSYAQTPALLSSLWNSLWVSALTTVVTVPTAFAFAYALTRSRMPCKPLLRGITLIPLLAPSLLSAISLIYWFGNQGVLKSWLT